MRRSVLRVVTGIGAALLVSTAALAPMAPPSVGVATPMKIVPSTRKIRNSGGTMTKVVCCAIVERKRKPVSRFTIQFKTATPNANKMPKNMDSTTKSAPCVSEFRIMYQPKTALAIANISNDHSPRLPSGSRKPTASAGRPGVAFGNRIEMMNA
jgi:hypothetical protein